MSWLTSVQSDSEAVNNLLLAADPAVLVDHPVPMVSKGILLLTLTLTLTLTWYPWPLTALSGNILFRCA